MSLCLVLCTQYRWKSLNGDVTIHCSAISTETVFYNGNTTLSLSGLGCAKIP